MNITIYFINFQKKSTSIRNFLYKYAILLTLNNGLGIDFLPLKIKAYNIKSIIINIII